MNSKLDRLDRAAERAVASPAGTTALLAGVLVLTASAIGVTMPDQVAVTFIAIAVMVVSAVSPRWAAERGLVPSHPAGLTAGLAAVVIWAASFFGAEVSAVDAALVVSTLIAVVGFLTPREADSDVDPPLGKQRL